MGRRTGATVPVVFRTRPPLSYRALFCDSGVSPPPPRTSRPRRRLSRPGPGMTRPRSVRARSRGQHVPPAPGSATRSRSSIAFSICGGTSRRHDGSLALVGVDLPPSSSVRCEPNTSLSACTVRTLRVRCRGRSPSRRSTRREPGSRRQSGSTACAVTARRRLRPTRPGTGRSVAPSRPARAAPAGSGAESGRVQATASMLGITVRTLRRSSVRDGAGRSRRSSRRPRGR